MATDIVMLTLGKVTDVTVNADALLACTVFTADILNTDATNVCTKCGVLRCISLLLSAGALLACAIFTADG